MRRDRTRWFSTLLLGAHVAAACSADPDKSPADPTADPAAAAPTTKVDDDAGAKADTDSRLEQEGEQQAAAAGRDGRDKVPEDAGTTPPSENASSLEPATDSTQQAGISGAIAAPTTEPTNEADSPQITTEPPNACRACDSYSAPLELGTVTVNDLAELSGMTSGRRNPDVLFAHNDRARADIYAMDQQGSLLVHYTLPGAQVTDVEDIGVGPCGTDTCLYLADFGDNRAQRTELAIFAVPEPDVAADRAAGTKTLTFERYSYRYADEPHNAEGLLVDPQNGSLYIVTKESAGRPSSVYALPREPSGTSLNEAEKVAELPIPGSDDDQASAAAAHPCAPVFAVRTYNTIYQFRAPAGGDLRAALDATPMQIDAATERQSEALTYSADGQALLSSGEGASAGIFQVRCQR